MGVDRGLEHPALLPGADAKSRHGHPRHLGAVWREQVDGRPRTYCAVCYPDRPALLGAGADHAWYAGPDPVRQGAAVLRNRSGAGPGADPCSGIVVV